MKEINTIADGAEAQRYNRGGVFDSLMEKIRQRQECELDWSLRDCELISNGFNVKVKAV